MKGIVVMLVVRIKVGMSMPIVILLQEMFSEQEHQQTQQDAGFQKEVRPTVLQLKGLRDHVVKDIADDGTDSSRH